MSKKQKLNYHNYALRMVSAKAVTRVMSISQNISKRYIMDQSGHQNDMHEKRREWIRWRNEIVTSCCSLEFDLGLGWCLGQGRCNGWMNCFCVHRSGLYNWIPTASAAARIRCLMQRDCLTLTWKIGRNCGKFCYFDSDTPAESSFSFLFPV